MFRYSAYSLIIDSELEIPELPRVEGTETEPDVVLRLGTGSSAPVPSSLQLEFASTRGVADFVVRDGREIVIYPHPASDPVLLRILLLGKVMAFLLRQRGWLPLHAAGVVADGRAVLFLGESGAGKSSTAAAFYAEGCPVIADDVAGIREMAGGCVVSPAGPRLRLTGDSRPVLENLEAPYEFQFDKFTFHLGSHPLRQTYPVAAIYLLEYGEGPRSERLPLPEAAAMLDSHSFIKRWRVNRDIVEFHLRSAARLASITPAYRLLRPRSLNALPRLVSFVRKEIAERE